MREPLKAGPTVPADPAARVLRQFRLAFNAVKTHFQQLEKSVGLGGAQLWALHVVQQTPDLGVNDLAQALQVRQPTASNLVRSLAEQGLLEVRRQGTDRRAVQLRVLPAGVRLLRRAPGPVAGVLPQALASLDQATLQRLEQDLGKLISVLGAGQVDRSLPLDPT